MNENRYEIEIRVRKNTEPYWHFLQASGGDDVVPLHVQERYFREMLHRIVDEACKQLFKVTQVRQ